MKNLNYRIYFIIKIKIQRKNSEIEFLENVFSSKEKKILINYLLQRILKSKSF
jgi:hypothetical protein